MSHGARHGRRADHGNREPERQLSGCIFRPVYGMGTPDSGGSGRRQTRRAPGSQSPCEAFSATFPPAEHPVPPEGENSNHRLNDKQNSPWYSFTDRQGNTLPCPHTKQAGGPASDEQGFPPGLRRIQQRLPELTNGVGTGKSEPSPGREHPVCPRPNRSGRRRGRR